MTNRIEIDAEPLGTGSGFAGPGAGGAATPSSAVLGDLLAVARGQRVDVGRSATGRGTRRCRDPVTPLARYAPTRRRRAPAIRGGSLGAFEEGTAEDVRALPARCDPARPTPPSRR